MHYPGNLTRSQAFTLIEILIALVIVAIVTAVAVMSFGDFGRKRREQLTIISVRNHLEAARQEAILSTGTIGLRFNQHGYRFYRYWIDPNSGRKYWRPITSDLSQPHAFLGPTIVIKPNPTFDHGKRPQFFFYPNGMLTPFRLSLTYPSNNRFDLIISSTGNIHIVSH